MTYLPEDAHFTVAALAYLHSPAGADLHAAAASLGTQPSVAEIAALRKRFPAEAMHVALVLARLQPKAASKFTPLSFTWATPEALEQASALTVARHKAARFATCGVTRVYDLCAGIGGETLALAEVAPVTAVELSPVRAACLDYNVQALTGLHPVEIVVDDVTRLVPGLPADAFVHIDPARRTAGKRSVEYADLNPGPEVLAAIERRVCPGGGYALKLSPGVDFSSFPEGHVELISHNGSVTQAVLWKGRFLQSLPAGQRSATMLRTGHASAPLSYTYTGLPGQAEVERSGLFGALLERTTGTPLPQAYLYEADGALTRAGLAAPLAHELGLAPLTADGGYLIGDQLLEPARHYLAAFRLAGACRYSAARVTALLRALDAAVGESQGPGLGPVEVKTRGRVPGVETDELQRVLSQASGRAWTVLIFRHCDETLAAVGVREQQSLPLGDA